MSAPGSHNSPGTSGRPGKPASPGAAQIPLAPFSELGLCMESDSYPRTDFTQMEFRGKVDVDALSEAFEKALAQFPVYQSHLREEKTGGRYLPYWEFDHHRANRLIVDDCRDRAPRPFDPMRFLSSYFRERMERRIDLANEFPLSGYLLRVDDDRHIFSICYHHVAMDALKGYRLLTDTLGNYHLKIRSAPPPWADSLGMASLGHRPKREQQIVRGGALGRFASKGAGALVTGFLRNGSATQLASEEKLSYRHTRGRHSLRLRYDDPKIALGLLDRAERSRALLDDLLLALTHRTITRWNREHDAPHNHFRTMLVVSLKSRLKLIEHAGAGLSALGFHAYNMQGADLDESIRYFRQRRFGMLKRQVDIRYFEGISGIFEASRFVPLALRRTVGHPLTLTLPIAAYVSNLGIVWPRVERGRAATDSVVLGAGDFEIADIHSSPSITRTIGLGITARIHARRLFINFVCDRFRFRDYEAHRLVELFGEELANAL